MALFLIQKRIIPPLCYIFLFEPPNIFGQEAPYPENPMQLPGSEGKEAGN